jgi:hypothetical protein
VAVSRRVWLHTSCTDIPAPPQIKSGFPSAWRSPLAGSFSGKLPSFCCRPTLTPLYSRWIRTFNELVSVFLLPSKSRYLSRYLRVRLIALASTDTRILTLGRSIFDAVRGALRS